MATWIAIAWVLVVVCDVALLWRLVVDRAMPRQTRRLIGTVMVLAAAVLVLAVILGDGPSG